MAQDPSHDPAESVDATWDGTFPDQVPPPGPAPTTRRPWLRTAGVVGAVIIAAAAGFAVGSGVRGTGAPDRPAVVEPGTPTGFDTRSPGRDASGAEVPFVNIRYYAFDTTATRTGFDGRCSQGAFLFAVGEFTPCSWALSVMDVFRGYDEDTYLGYEPSFVSGGVAVYCHYQNPGLIFRDKERTKGVPVWECRADGGRQLVFAGLTMSMVPPEECWAPDGTLRSDLSIYAGSPAEKERPRVKPEHPTPIEDCTQ
ncbi:hypothetical protein ACWF62_14335 [Rhodococcus sp. NPDC054953]